MAVVGWIVIAFGIWGLFEDSSRTHPDQWIRWFLGGAIAHDYLVAPLVFAAGRFVVARVPLIYRPSVQGGLVASALVATVAWPLVAGFGRSAGNPSALPSNYALGLGVVLVIVWTAAATSMVRAHAVASTKPRAKPPTCSA
jgi:hypothetical protein